MTTLSKEDILEAVSNMSVVDVCDLVKMMEEKFDVSAAAPMMMGAMSTGAAGGEAAAEEKTEFDVHLTSAGDKKIQTIKAVRALTGLGLKEAKELVDGAPKLLKEGVSKDEAEKMKVALEEAGASAELK